MIDEKQVLLIHNILMERFGGTKGLRDSGALDAAIKRPWATFADKELYPSIASKVAAIVESIVINHPFVDGNKRTGYVLMRLLLLEHGYDLTATEDEKYELIISVAEGKTKFAEIQKWIEERLIARK